MRLKKARQRRVTQNLSVILGAALALAASACATRDASDEAKGWFADRADAMRGKGFPDVRNIPPAPRGLRALADWDKLDGQLRQDLLEMLALEDPLDATPTQIEEARRLIASFDAAIGAEPPALPRDFVGSALEAIEAPLRPKP